MHTEPRNQSVQQETIQCRHERNVDWNNTVESCCATETVDSSLTNYRNDSNWRDGSSGNDDDDDDDNGGSRGSSNNEANAARPSVPARKLAATAANGEEAARRRERLERRKQLAGAAVLETTGPSQHRRTLFLFCYGCSMKQCEALRWVSKQLLNKHQHAREGSTGERRERRTCQS